MRHNKKRGMKLGTDASHTKAMKKSLVCALLANDRIKTLTKPENITSAQAYKYNSAGEILKNTFSTETKWRPMQVHSL